VSLLQKSIEIDFARHFEAAKLAKKGDFESLLQN